MKMNRVIHGGVVHKAHHRLTAPLNEKGRPRRDGVIAYEVSRTFAGVDLRGEGQDVDLVVVDGVACDGILDLPSAC